MSENAYVVGVDMVKFSKPGTHEPYRVMASNAIKGALKNAGIEVGKVQQAYRSYIYGDSTCGQRALYDVGMTGIPVINVNNNCSSGSTALFLARQAVASGAVDCALALRIFGAAGLYYMEEYDAKPDIFAKVAVKTR